MRYGMTMLSFQYSDSMGTNIKLDEDAARSITKLSTLNLPLQKLVNKEEYAQEASQMFVSKRHTVL